MSIKYDTIIRQGVSFYREIEGVTCAKGRTVAELRAMTPRATLLGTSISMPCSWLGDETKADMAWTLSRDMTAALDPSRTYEYNVDLYDDTDTIEVATGRISVKAGQKPV